MNVKHWLAAATMVCGLTGGPSRAQASAGMYAAQPAAAAGAGHGKGIWRPPPATNTGTQGGNGTVPNGGMNAPTNGAANQAPNPAASNVQSSTTGNAQANAQTTTGRPQGTCPKAPRRVLRKGPSKPQPQSAYFHPHRKAASKAACFLLRLKAVSKARPKPGYHKALYPEALKPMPRHRPAGRPLISRAH